MKKIKLILLQLSLVTFVYSQTNTFPTTGNTGIGTTSPSSPFTIRTTLNQGDPIFDFGNPQQYNQILFKDRDFSSFLFGLRSNQIDIGTPNNNHKIMSVQSNANNITLWPVFSINSGSNIIMSPSQNVGIGTSAPNYKLDVNGSVNATQFLINGSPIGSLNTLWLNNASGIYYNGSGNVGIGTTAPSAPLEIGNTLSQGATIFKFGNPQQNNQIIFRDRDRSSFLFGVDANQVKIGISGSDHKMMSAQANSQNIELWPTVAINSPNNILINAGQNVGIGNTNPQSKLDVTGAVNATQYLVNGNPLVTLSGSGNNFYLPNNANFGIGTSSPQYNLDVVGSARVSGNLLVGGGVITSQTVNAGSKINAGDLDATGNLNIAGISTFNGSTNFNGTLKIGGFGQGGDLAINPNGQVVLSLNTHPPVISCVPGSPQWSMGGDNFSSYQSAVPPYAIFGEASAGTCNNYDFILKANAVNRIWIKTDGKLGFGTSSPSEMFHFSDGNVLIDEINSSGSSYRLKVKASDQPGFSVETNQSTDNNFNTRLLVNRDLTKALSIANTNLNSLGDEKFVVYGNGNTNIGNGPFGSVNKLLTVNGGVCFGSGGGLSGLEIVGQDQVPTRRGISVETDPNGDMSFFVNSFQNGVGPEASAFRFKNGILNGNNAPTASQALDVMAVNNVGQFTLTTFLPTNSGASVFTIKNINLPSTPNIWNQYVFDVQADGKTRIGTQIQNFGAHTDALLSVFGKLVATEVVVSQLNWADYVFQKNYKLPTWIETENYFRKNEHLKDVPTAKEIIENGNNVAETEVILLKKIEESYLYIGDLHKENDQKTEQIKKLTDENILLNKKYSDLESRLTKLENN